MERIEKLTEKLSEKIDCALITSDVNRRYFCGMKSSDGVIAVFRKKAYLLIDFRYYEKAAKAVKCCEVILLENLKQQLGELFVENNVQIAAVESETMTLAELSRYQKMFPSVDFLSDDTLSRCISELRKVKDNDEIKKITAAQRIAEQALETLMENEIIEGVTERELAIKLNNLMLHSGAEDISFDTIVLFGENSSLPHGVPSARKLEKGDNILIDFGAVYEGYHSDMTRTFCFGEPSEEFVKVYNIVLEAQKNAIDYARAGIKGSELDNIARSYIEENGYGKAFGHSLGHGVGMEIHEKPTASSRSEEELVENSVITIEPGIYLQGKFGVRIEDFVVLKAHNCVNLTLSPKNLIVI